MKPGNRTVLLLTTVFLSLTLIPLYLFPSLPWRLSTGSALPLPSPPSSRAVAAGGKDSERCDLSKGEWVPDPKAPYYTNESCWAIHENQNCMKYGRPDAGFLRWRWRPDGCELPKFNPAQFLELVRGKSLAFVGDSVGRNQMQSLICLLLRVTHAVDASLTQDKMFQRYHFPAHNFTVASLWSPFLVRAQPTEPNGSILTGLFNLYLDEPDTNWAAEVEEFDIIIVSVGHWFFRPNMYYENGQLVGCHYCQRSNVTDLTRYYGYRMAFRTAFRAFNNLTRFKGTVFLRTFSPAHFEGGEWNRGGDCLRQRPFNRTETRLEGYNLEMYMTQIEELNAAAAEGRKRGIKFRLLDTTEAMLLRPDGHPSRYGHLPNANVILYNDCVHWCLPGPIDTWNDFLLFMMKSEGGRSTIKGQSLYNRTSTIR
ncbi:protein trichome birefringence-like 19 [Zingiber officinale]|uniref:Trichome birefringence-like N-terminal domain-containing protein n=1 Tax=Zingiber officinale TaxID=94328 RepID=A0A8J5LE91_ZINOF|nr:protein trichome birefringence-like 19 [Zingiber officinale]KAG6509638.1 hypothetical protein ZIOFF_027638 [Zingiber officinale]